MLKVAAIMCFSLMLGVHSHVVIGRDMHEP